MTQTAPAPVIDTGCCPRFDPEPWDETEIEFDQRLFVKDRVRSLLHIPLNFGRVMVRNIERIEAAGADDPAMITLADERSLWGADVFLSVTKEVPGAKNVYLSGRYLSKVFEGPFRDIRAWMQQMDAFVAARGQQARRTLFYYTTCPRCAKAYGRNYVVLLAELRR